MKRRLVVYGSLFLIALAGGAYWYVRGDRPNEITKALTPLHNSMSPSDIERGPSEGNPGQTLTQYKLTHSTGETGKLYVQPFGELSTVEMELVEETAEFLSVFFSAPTEVLEPILDDIIPDSARRQNDGHEQFDAHYILYDVLKQRKPDDAIAVLAITATDLFPRDEWNFVFGLASLIDGIGVWSLYRYGEAGTEEFRDRIFKVAIHETGHMFGIKHCVAFRCQMNAAKTRLEVDRAPIWFCPVCVQKVAYSRELELADYFADLAKYAGAHGRDIAGEYWSKSHDVVSALP